MQCHAARSTRTQRRPDATVAVRNATAFTLHDMSSQRGKTVRNPMRRFVSLSVGGVVLGIGLSTVASGHALDTANIAAPEAAQRRFDVLDANRDGVLSKYEYDSDVVFEAADRDRDQLLSPQELQDAMGPQSPDAPTAPERMLAFDLDRDGRLDDAELRRALEMRFSWLDRNADGGLDFDEMKAGFGTRVRP